MQKAYLLIFIGFFEINCNNEKPCQGKVFKIPEYFSASEAYALSFNETTFWVVSEQCLYAIHTSDMEIDSISLSNETGLFHALSATSNGVILLSFEKNTQYDTSKIKYIHARMFDESLYLIRYDSFLVNKGWYLLEEDFMFPTSYYYPPKDSYFFNFTLGRVSCAERGYWKGDIGGSGFVDVITGTQYLIKTDSSICVLSDKDENIACFPHKYPAKQMSAFDDKIIYAHSKNMYLQKKGSDEVSRVSTCDFTLNPCRRTSRGLYKFERNHLIVYSLY
jgi:hypothetical protein